MRSITKLHETLATQLQDEEGAAMVEYGLLIFFIALAVIAVLTLLGPEIAGMFQDVVDGITGAGAGGGGTA